MSLKSETSVRKKVAFLERRKTMLNALITFLQAHPELSNECSLFSLHGKVGLKFSEYALIVPFMKESKPVLRLKKSGDDWLILMDADAFYRMERTVAEDVSSMTDDELETLLDQVYREANPDEGEDEEE